MNAVEVNSDDSFRLCMLMVADEAELPGWGTGDLGEVWEHQLSAPLPGSAEVHFRDVLHGSAPPVKALELIAQFAAARRDDARSAYPRAVAEVLFTFAQVLLNVVRGPQALDGADSTTIQRLLRVAWLDEATRSILRNVAERHGTDPDTGATAGRGVHAGMHDSFPLVQGYEVLAPLGAGGMGTVWRARQLATRREVALKLMNAAAFESRPARERFEREVELTARLQHPNIARIYDSGLSRGVWFYAMELIDGWRLDEYARAKRLSRRGILELMTNVSRAVQHAHERGVIHRDLKPSNILVSSDGQPHLLDFGLARTMAGPGQTAMTFSIQGDISGTVGFMAPERFAGGPHAADTRSDVYSLGVVLYLLLLGRMPHGAGASQLEQMRQVQETDPARPRRIDPGIEAELEAVMLKALHREPGRRYPSAGALGDDLENLLRGDPVSARPPTLGYFIRKRAKKHRLTLGIAAVAGVSILVVVVLAYVRIAIERNEAIIARAAAEDARRSADEQRRTAERERRTAQVRLADGLVSRGDAMAQSSRWIEARQSYEEARLTLAALGQPTLAADAGLAVAFGHAPPPLNFYVGHTAAITATAFSADETFAASGSRDKTARLWDLVTGREVRVFTGHRSAVTSIAVSPGNQTLVAGGDDGTVMLWDISTGRQRSCFRHSQKVCAVTFSADGQRAASASLDGTACVWDVLRGQRICAFPPSGKSAAPLTSVAFLPDGHHCMSRLQSAGIVVWDAATGEQTSAGGYMSDTSSALSPDGRLALTGGADAAREVRLWGLSDPSRPIRTFSTQGRAVASVAFSSDDGQVISACRDGTFRFWNAASGDLLRTVWGDGGQPRNVSISPGGEFALTAGGFDASDCTMKLWDIASPHIRRPGSAFSLDPGLSNAPARNSSGGPAPAPSNGPVTSLALSGDGRIAAVVGERGPVDLFDTAAWHLVARFGDGENDPHHTAALSPDDSQMLEGVGRGVWIWDIATGKAVFLGKHSDNVRAVALSPNCRFGLSQSGNQIIYWDLTRQRALRTIHFDRVLGAGIRFSADGAMALGVNTHGAAMYWLLATGWHIPVPGFFNDGHVPSELGAVFRPGSNEVLNGREDEVVMWDAFTGSPIFTFAGHTDRVNALAVSPDGTWAVSGGSDAAVRLWDLQQRKDAGVLSCGGTAMTAVAITPDGSRVLAGEADGTLRQWDLGSPGRCMELQTDLDSARKALRERPADAEALAAFGRWYARRGIHAWAIDLLRRARAGGADVPELLLARCCWEANDNTAAAAEFKEALKRGEAPRQYLELCLSAAEHGGSPRVTQATATRAAE